MPNADNRNPPDVARQELRQFLQMANQVGMDADCQRRSMRLSHDEWEDWLGILKDAPLPSHPALPLVLRHLGYLNSRLDHAGRRGFAYG